MTNGEGEMSFIPNVGHRDVGFQLRRAVVRVSRRWLAGLNKLCQVQIRNFIHELDPFLVPFSVATAADRFVG